jgi:predicted DNA-binding transcriptional regulator YafY
MLFNSSCYESKYIGRENMRGRILKKLVDAINLLAQPTGTTISSLCEHLDIDKRQAYRVLETIQLDFGFVVDKDKTVLGGEARYYLDKEFCKKLLDMKVANLNLSLPEIISLYFLKGHAKLYKGTDIETNIERAFAKLDVFVPEGLGNKLEKVKTLLISDKKFVKDYSKKDEIIDKITSAIMKQQTCEVEYHSFTDDRVKKYFIDPLAFCEYNGGIYLFAVARKYDEIRLLAVERVKKLSLTDKNFEYPGDFDPDALLEEAFGLVYDDPIKVKIRFSADQARYIQERCWAKNQKIEKQKDGSIILSMTTSGWFDVKKWILSYGAEAELLEPADKRNELKEEAKQLTNLYK